ncbi:MAG: hypothetical protein H6581_29950 [Bacteroidia bacterium]|nr:hypothetical protein [Bacteroidia bacterium]
MKQNLITTLAAFALVFATVFSLKASAIYLEPGQDAREASFQQVRWERLGARNVNYGLDHDEILVTAAEGKFTAVKLFVKKAPINMHRMVIHFANGADQEVELRNTIPAGGESRVIDLEGGQRIIRRVSFWYDTKGIMTRKGSLILWGRH